MRSKKCERTWGGGRFDEDVFGSRLGCCHVVRGEADSPANYSEDVAGSMTRA